MQKQQAWRLAYYALLIAFLGTAALNMLHIRAGFLTNHVADLVVPAWLYLAARGLHAPERTTLLRRTIGRTPESAALILFGASALTEISQRFWPHGIFAGRFDPLDLIAYASGIAVCYTAERLSTLDSPAVELGR